MKIRVVHERSQIDDVDERSVDFAGCLPTKRVPICFLLFFFFLSFFLSACRSSTVACDDSRGCIIIRPNEPYQIVALLPLTGPAAFLGEEALSGIELAIANRGNLFREHPLELVVLDSACDPAAASGILQNVLAEAPPAAIIGPACSDVATVIAPLLDQKAVLLISPLITAPDLTDGNMPGIFRLAPDHQEQANSAASFAYAELKARKVLVLTNGASYSQQLSDRFTTTFTQLGGTVVNQPVFLTAGSTMDLEVAAIEQAAPDALYMPIFAPEANLLVNQIQAEDMELPIIGSDSLFDPAFAVSGGAAVRGLYLTQTAVTGEAYQQFLRLWTAQGKAPAQSAAPPFAYDAVNFLLEALEDVTLLSDNNTLVIPREALQSRLLATKAYDGLTGIISCDLNGDCAAENLIGVYQFRVSDVQGETWPPALVWLPDGS